MTRRTALVLGANSQPAESQAGEELITAPNRVVTLTRPLPTSGTNHWRLEWTSDGAFFYGTIMVSVMRSTIGASSNQIAALYQVQFQRYATNNGECTVNLHLDGGGKSSFYWDNTNKTFGLRMLSDASNDYVATVTLTGHFTMPDADTIDSTAPGGSTLVYNSATNVKLGVSGGSPSTSLPPKYAGSEMLLAANHGSSGDPHTQYALDSDKDVSGGYPGYTTGTFTPAISPGTYSYTTQNGQYVKIGKLCFIHIDLVINVVTSAPGSAFTITGLPFNAANSLSTEIMVCRVATLNLGTSAKWVTFETTFGASTLGAVENNDNGTVVAILASAISNGTSMRINGFYEV